MKRILPYLLPIITILIILSILFIRPAITTSLVTGKAIFNPNTKILTAKITISLDPVDIIPEDSLIIIKLDDKEAGMPVKEFIKKTKLLYEIKQGQLKDINYEGPGFLGREVYQLDISEFKLNTNLLVGEHTLITKIIYKDKMITESKETFSI